MSDSLQRALLDARRSLKEKRAQRKNLYEQLSRLESEIRALDAVVTNLEAVTKGSTPAPEPVKKSWKPKTLAQACFKAIVDAKRPLSAMDIMFGIEKLEFHIDSNDPINSIRRTLETMIQKEHLMTLPGDLFGIPERDMS